MICILTEDELGDKFLHIPTLHPLTSNSNLACFAVIQ